MNSSVTISECHGIDPSRAQLLRNHARSLLQRLPGINIKDIRNPVALSRLISHVDPNPDLYIHVDLSRLMYFRYLIAHPPNAYRIFSAPESYGYRLVMRIAEPYNTREIILIGDAGDDRAIAEWGNYPDFHRYHRELTEPHEHNPHGVPVDLIEGRRNRRVTDRYAPSL